MEVYFTDGFVFFPTTGINESEVDCAGVQCGQYESNIVGASHAIGGGIGFPLLGLNVNATGRIFRGQHPLVSGGGISLDPQKCGLAGLKTRGG